jgi:flagellar biosynthesis/type III secretory pathway protein FliH
VYLSAANLKIGEEITSAAMKDELTDEKLLLIDRWVGLYKKIPAHRINEIRKEIKMDFVETTITEHVFNQGKIEGEAKGKAEGKVEGKVEGQLELLQKLYQEGILTAKQLKAKTEPLRQMIRQLTT